MGRRPLINNKVTEKMQHYMMAGMIAWSWWLVMMPVIVVFGLPIVIGLLVLLIVLIVDAFLFFWWLDWEFVLNFKKGFHDGLKKKMNDESSKNEN